MVALHGDWLFGGSKKDAAVEVWRQRLSAMTVPFVVLGGSGWFWVVLGGSGWLWVVLGGSWCRRKMPQLRHYGNVILGRGR